MNVFYYQSIRSDVLLALYQNGQQQSKITNIQSSIPELNIDDDQHQLDGFEATVGEVNTPNNFYLIIKSMPDLNDILYKAMDAALNNFYNGLLSDYSDHGDDNGSSTYSSILDPDFVIVGNQLVAAKIPSDVAIMKHGIDHVSNRDQWARAFIIENAVHYGLVFCFFIDHGFTAFVQETDIHPLDDRFKKLPQRSFKASLFGINPDRSLFWSVKLNEYFKELVTDKKIQVYIEEKVDPNNQQKKLMNNNFEWNIASYECMLKHDSTNINEQMLRYLNVI